MRALTLFFMLLAVSVPFVMGSPLQVARAPDPRGGGKGGGGGGGGGGGRGSGGSGSVFSTGNSDDDDDDEQGEIKQNKGKVATLLDKVFGKRATTREQAD